MRFAAWIAAGLVTFASTGWAQRPYEGGRADRSRYMDERVPQRQEMRNVASIATRLDRLMADIEERAKDKSDDIELSRRETEAWRRLRILSARADAFKETLERTPDRPDWSVDDYEKLLGAYLLVDERVETLYRSGLVNADFRKVQDLMDDLVSYYGGYPPYGGRAYERLTMRAEGGDAYDGVTLRRSWNRRGGSRSDEIEAREQGIPREILDDGAGTLEVPDTGSGPSWADD